MNEKRVMGEIEKLCKDGHTDALLYLCRNYGDAAIEGYRRGYRKAFWTGLGVSSLIVTGCIGAISVIMKQYGKKNCSKEGAAKRRLSSFRLFYRSFYGGDCYGNQK